MLVANSAKLRALGLASRKERQGQNHPSGFVLYRHHQGRIVVRALFSQLYDFALGIGKCRCDIRQICTMRVILKPTRSAYCEEISRHPKAPKGFFGPKSAYAVIFLRVL
jgi:hypothetical protein